MGTCLCILGLYCTLNIVFNFNFNFNGSLHTSRLNLFSRRVLMSKTDLPLYWVEVLLTCSALSSISCHVQQLLYLIGINREDLVVKSHSELAELLIKLFIFYNFNQLLTWNFFFFVLRFRFSLCVSSVISSEFVLLTCVRSFLFQDTLPDCSHLVWTYWWWMPVHSRQVSVN